MEEIYMQTEDLSLPDPPQRHCTEEESAYLNDLLKGAGSKDKRRRRNTISGYAITVWPFVGFIAFMLIPILLSLIISFTSAKDAYMLTEMEWVGFDNYVKLFSYPKFWTAWLNTIIYASMAPVQLVVCLVLAQFIRKIRWGGKAFRVILFIPALISAVVMSTVWKWIFNENYGIMNMLLESIGLGPVRWLNEQYRLSIILYLVLTCSGGILLFEGALSSVNTSYYEAAKIDGASEVTIFLRITVPIISPTIFYQLIMNFIAGLQTYIVCQLFNPSGTQFGPNDQGLTIVWYMYHMIFTEKQFYGIGIGCATAWVVSLFIMIFTLLNFKLQKLWVHYED